MSQGLASRPLDRSSWRDQYTAFVERHEVAWELTMAAVTIAWVAVSFVFDETPEVLAFDFAVWVILGAEFVSRFVATRDRRTYLKGHWIDAIALIPAARAFRLLRLFRLIRLVRAFAGIYRALTAFEGFATNRQLIGLFLAWLAVAFICSVTLFLAESDVNHQFDGPGDALWWGVVTLTTVGYGDVVPETLEGRLAAGGLMVIGITLFAAITGSITSALIASRDGTRSSTVDRLRDLQALRDEALISAEEFDHKRSEILESL